MPGIAPGWPVTLPGSIIGTPIVAHVTADGRPSIIVTCAARNENQVYAHPHPTAEPLIYALTLEGNVVPGWPIKLGQETHGQQWGGWASSPSVIPGATVAPMN